MAGQRARRRTLRLPVRFRPTAEIGSQTGHTTNVSATGMFIATRCPPALATRVEVTVLREGDSLNILGEVVRAVLPSAADPRAETGGFAIRFLTPDEPSVRTLVGHWQQRTTRLLQSRALR